MGLTLVYTLSRLKGFIGLPEVVELELKRQIVEAGLDAVSDVKGPRSILHTLTGDPLLGVELPGREKFEELVDKRLSELSRVLTREAFTLEHAKAALEMVGAKVPPNQHKQQFKDSAIWQAVLSFSQRYEVTLLTTDNAFFDGCKPARGLAVNLLDDCRKAGSTVLVYTEIAQYLGALKGDVPEFDRDRVKVLVVEAVKGIVSTQAKNYLVEPAEVLDFSVSAFRTEMQDRLALDYTVTFHLEPIPAPSRTTGSADERAVVHGSTYYLLGENALVENYIQRVSITGPGRLSARSFRDYDGMFPFPRPLPRD